MAKRVTLSTRYGSYMPVLIQALRKTTGDVIELGGGVYSTHYLHWICTLDKRVLFTYENSKEWYDWIKDYKNIWHYIFYVENWKLASLDHDWDVALVDLSPNEMRVEMIEKLQNNTKYIIIHDSNGRHNHIYHYDTVYPLFRYVYTFDKIEPSTTVLSNFVDLKDFM
jgi:hypothetical protein